MALVSSRLPIAKAIVALLQAIQDPTTSQPLYGFVKLGAVFNPGAATTWCEVYHSQGQSEHAGSGGNQIQWRIDDTVRYQVTSAVGPYETNDSTAQIDMLALQDIVLPELHKHFQLPDASNPTNTIQSVYSLLANQPDRSIPTKYPNGHVYLLWHVFVTAKQGYNIELVQP
jgi:hypothetical protein